MIMIVLHVIFTFNNFGIVYLSTGGGPLGNTEVLATYVYKTAFRDVRARLRGEHGRRDARCSCWFHDRLRETGGHGLMFEVTTDGN